MTTSLKAVHTYFNRAANGRSDLLTTDDFRRIGRLEDARNVTWRTAARKRAARLGGALVMLADDSLVCFTKLSTGKIRQTTYKPGKWSWDPSAE